MLFNNWNLISTEIILYSLKLALEELRLNLAFKFIQIEFIYLHRVLVAQIHCTIIIKFLIHISSYLKG